MGGCRVSSCCASSFVVGEYKITIEESQESKERQKRIRKILEDGLKEMRELNALSKAKEEAWKDH